MAKKRVNKSKEEIIKEAKKLEEVSRMRVIVKDRLYPTLLKYAKSPEDARNICSVAAMSIKQAFQNQMRDQKVSDFKMLDMIDKKSPDYQKFKEILEIVDKETVANGVGLLEGFTNLIDSSIREEMMKKPLSDLKVELL